VEWSLFERRRGGMINDRVGRLFEKMLAQFANGIKRLVPAASS